MVRISVNGWVAEGGGRVIHAPEGDFIIFDVIENEYFCGGMDDSDRGSNNAWFHCSFKVEKSAPEELSHILEGEELLYVPNSGKATFISNIADSRQLSADQIASFIEAGGDIWVRGKELLLKGEGGQLMRTIVANILWFEYYGMPRKPHLLKVPYKSNQYYPSKVNEVFI